MASDDHGTTGNLLEMARQASCIAAYLHRGDIELAAWLLVELQQQLHEFVALNRNADP